MLEKIGLPPKPSMRGGSWVVDASHCQGCSSQFTLINRKHHCRRCGGLFCNSCTQQRMILRGQGDSPVRICDPCKKIEEAARFEMRYGHKNRATKGNPKQVTNHEEEILSQILGIDGKQALSSEQVSHVDLISDLQQFASSASSSNLMEESATPGRGDIIRSMSVDVQHNALVDTGSNSPEQLRQQAVEEKKKYKILKAEGKSEEALQAFKRGKELERQAGALEIALRKSRRMASKASNSVSVPDNRKTDDGEESTSRKKLPSQSSKEKDDLAAELRNLGWSDADLHGADKKPKISLEGELSNLIGEITQRSSQGTKTGGIDKSQVTAHKRKALSLKREGKLAEAKEELKKAKILEKQIEEQELLGEAEDSDDELSALIRNMDDDNKDELLLDHAPDPGINFDNFLGVTDDFTVNGNFEVTDDDMNNPELAAALKSFGWTEEDDEPAVSHASQPVLSDCEALRGQVLTLKREALSQKQIGNVAEAVALLKRAKLLERDLQSMQSDAEVSDPELKQKASTSQISGNWSEVRTANDGHAPEAKHSYVKLPPKSKLAIQKELLALKRKALALRREGRLQEAEEELNKGKVLERQLEEMENEPKRPEPEVVGKNLGSVHVYDGDPMTLDLQEEGLGAEVTDQDMHDPALLSVLDNFGWNDDDNAEPVSMSKTSRQMSEQLIHDGIPSVLPQKSMRSKVDIQRELLALKRKALALRRQGKSEEADEELEKAKVLEKQMAEIEVLNNASSMEVKADGSGSLISQKKFDNHKAAGQNTNADLLSFEINKIPENEGVAAVGPSDIGTKMINETTKPPLTESSGSISETLWFDQTQRKQSRQAEEKSAEHAFLKPKLGESLNLDLLSASEETVLQSSVELSAPKEMVDANSFSVASAPSQSKVQSCLNGENDNEIPPHRASNFQLAQQKETTVYTPSILMASEEKSAHRIDPLKDEILARKRKAVALKREGKLAEAREELRQAKLLEKGLEDGQQADTGIKSVSASTSDNTTVMLDSKTNPSQKPISGRDRFKIQQQSLAHKRNALKLRREGKIQESDAEFELAKALENQLEESDTVVSSTTMATGKIQAIDDPVVEDLLDPQMMSALKAIGWQESDIGIQPSKKLEPKPSVSDSGNPSSEKTHLEEQIKSEKLRALNLKRAGKQAEALEALRLAKRLERKFDSLT